MSIYESYLIFLAKQVVYYHTFKENYQLVNIHSKKKLEGTNIFYGTCFFFQGQQIITQNFRNQKAQLPYFESLCSIVKNCETVWSSPLSHATPTLSNFSHMLEKGIS